METSIILSVLGRGQNEMAAVHLINCYCVPTLTYACETWNLSPSDYHTVSVLWNNVFRCIFNCCWRESTSASVVLWMPSNEVYY